MSEATQKLIIARISALNSRSYLSNEHERPFAVSCTQQQIELLAKYFELLKSWNERMDLVAPASDEVLVERHIIDSLAGSFIIEQELSSLSYADVGSGAGLPGIVLAIFTQKSVSLIEPREKRTQFLREVKRRLDLNNVSVRQESYEASDFGAAQCVTARALGDYEKLLQRCEGLVQVQSVPREVALFVASDWQAPRGNWRMVSYEVPREGASSAQHSIAIDSLSSA